MVNAKDKNVVVVVGGDTGNDCVGTCIRMGCKSVIQIEMMDEPLIERSNNNPCPLWPVVKKTDYSQSEAIAIFKKDPCIYNTTVNQIITDDNGQIKQIETVKIYKKILRRKITL